MTEQEAMELGMQEVAPSMPSAAPAKSGGVLDSIKENLDLNTLVEKVKSSKDRLFEIALYGGIGLISGFLLKRYSAYVGICILLMIGLGVLHHLGVINVMVNWDKVNELFGIQAAQNYSADNIIATVWE